MNITAAFNLVVQNERPQIQVPTVTDATLGRRPRFRNQVQFSVPRIAIILGVSIRRRMSEYNLTFPHAR